MITPYRPAKIVDVTGRTNCRLSRRPQEHSQIPQTRRQPGPQPQTLDANRSILTPEAPQIAVRLPYCNTLLVDRERNRSVAVLYLAGT